jgi:hypothetical protein
MTNHNGALGLNVNPRVSIPLPSNPKRKRKSRYAALLTGGILAATLGNSPAAYAAPHLPGAFSGSAIALGSDATTGPVATRLAAGAQEICPCDGTDGKLLQNATGPIIAAPALSATATITSVRTERGTATARIVNRAKVTRLSMLGGLITADAVTAVAGVGVNKNTMTPVTAGSLFQNLKIAGTAYPAIVPPNTVVALPGIGNVTLNSQDIVKDNSAVTSVHVDMLAVTITAANSFGLPVAAHVNIGDATAIYRRKAPAVAVTGGAFATGATANADNILTTSIGHAANVTIPCEGTGGNVKVNTADLVNVAKIATVVQATSTAVSGPRLKGTYARTTSVIRSVNLLNGLIQATNLRANVVEQLNGDKLRSGTAGSGFDLLKIAGVSLPITAAPNTTLPLPGLGKVVVNEQIKATKPGDTTTVNGLHVSITTANLLKLPVGTQIYIAHAAATLAPLAP